MKYTNKKIIEYLAYLRYGVKEGYLDMDEVDEIIKNKDWEQVEYMMDRGDYEANGGDE